MIKVDISGNSQINIFYASAASPFQQSSIYNGRRTKSEIEKNLNTLRAEPGGFAFALIFSHTHKLGAQIGVDIETGEYCKFDGSI